MGETDLKQKTILFCSGKGGVGKSTVAACAAAAMVSGGQRVLLIDADQGVAGLHLVLGLSEPPVFDLCDAFAGVCDFQTVIRGCAALPGLHVATASLNPEKQLTPARLSRFCALVSGVFDRIFIDAPAGLGDGFQTALAVCGEAVIVVTPDPVSLAAAAKTGQCLAEAERPGRLIVNRYDRRLVRQMPDADRFMDATGCRLLGIVPLDAALTRLSVTGQGVLKLPRGAASAKPFYNIAGRLAGREIPLARL